MQPSGKSVACGYGDTVLMGLEKAGYALPNNCRAGACGECKVKVVSEQFDQGMVLDRALSQDERRQGVGLMCMAKPISEVIVIEWGTEDAKPKLFAPREQIAARAYSISNASRPDGELVLQVALVEAALRRAFKKPVTLLFSARTRADVFGRGMMAWWRAKHRNFDYKISLTRESADGFESGRIHELLPRLLKDLSRQTLFIAGSPAFVHSCQAAVQTMGALPEHVISEGFFDQALPL